MIFVHFDLNNHPPYALVFRTQEAMQAHLLDFWQDWADRRGQWDGSPAMMLFAAAVRERNFDEAHEIWGDLDREDYIHIYDDLTPEDEAPLLEA